ncbi:colorectal mutant cancer protein [Leptonychotes weddellii]|uniref:Colorectal mutant cancer protein n=1 Tax=Leptonychotes weddellii TaxID=9713 RepID=A0A7F8PYD1_LEPWE|nr:colorectal mutant cancer protein [Leptonychotes weddellii]
MGLSLTTSDHNSRNRDQGVGRAALPPRALEENPFLTFQLLVRELQTRLQSVQATGPSSPGRLTSANRPVNPSTGELSTSSSSNDIPIAKIAERVKLSKTRSESSSSDRPVLGSEISSIGVSVREMQDRVPSRATQMADRSTTSSTASSCDTEFTKEDEQRLKDYIQQLRNDRAAVKLTMLELESIHIDPLSYDVKPRGDSQRLDLENAVLMQELMAMKEEMAELKAQLYLLEKEKKALELKLSTREAQEQAYLVHIEHLKSEVEEQKEQCTRSLSSTSSGGKDKPGKECADAASPALSLAELRTTCSDSELAAEFANAIRREKKLKVRVQELVSALERLTKSSEIRHQQSAEFVNDLKRANSNLVAAYEKAKKKHQNKLKKLESQMMAMVERHETQVRMLKQRIALLEEENSRPHTNETSL